MILQFLEALRPSNVYHIELRQMMSLAREIQNRVQNCYQPTVGDIPDDIIDVPLQFRCGRPLNPSFQKSKLSFFYKEVYETHLISQNSCFINNTNIFKLFFGRDSEIPNIDESSMAPEFEAQSNLNSHNSNFHEVNNDMVPKFTEQPNNQTNQESAEQTLLLTQAPSLNTDQLEQGPSEQEPQPTSESFNAEIASTTPKRVRNRLVQSSIFQIDLDSKRPVIVDHNLHLIKISDLEQWTKHWMRDNVKREHTFHITNGANNTGFTERRLAVQAMKASSRTIMHIFDKHEYYHPGDHETTGDDVCSCLRAKRMRPS